MKPVFGIVRRYWTNELRVTELLVGLLTKCKVLIVWVHITFASR
jgi:hypothetical protein